MENIEELRKEWNNLEAQRVKIVSRMTEIHSIIQKDMEETFLKSKGVKIGDIVTVTLKTRNYNDIHDKNEYHEDVPAVLTSVWAYGTNQDDILIHINRLRKNDHEPYVRSERYHLWEIFDIKKA